MIEQRMQYCRHIIAETKKKIDDHQDKWEKIKAEKIDSNKIYMEEHKSRIR